MASNIISKGARESAQPMMAVWGAWPSSTNWRRAACLVLEPNGRPSPKRRLPSFQGTGSDRSSHDSNLRRVHANSWTDSCQACAAKLQRSKLWVCLVFAAPSASTSGLWQLIYSKQLKCLSFWIFGCCCVKYGSFFNLWIAVLQELEGIFRCHWWICCCADLANLSRGAQGQSNISKPIEARHDTKHLGRAPIVEVNHALASLNRLSNCEVGTHLSCKNNTSKLEMP